MFIETNLSIRFGMNIIFCYQWDPSSPLKGVQCLKVSACRHVWTLFLHPFSKVELIACVKRWNGLTNIESGIYTRIANMVVFHLNAGPDSVDFVSFPSNFVVVVSGWRICHWRWKRTFQVFKQIHIEHANTPLIFTLYDSFKSIKAIFIARIAVSMTIIVDWWIYIKWNRTLRYYLYVQPFVVMESEEKLNFVSELMDKCKIFDGKSECFSLVLFSYRLFLYFVSKHEKWNRTSKYVIWIERTYTTNTNWMNIPNVK